MEYLARISTGLMNEYLCKQLLTTKDVKEVYELIAKTINVVEDTEIKVIKESNSNQQKAIDESKPLIIGVSACATGIVHTFVTREALEGIADEMHVNVHIETEGQNGREHALTDELIEKADYVIIASDINVDTERFFGKKYFSVEQMMQLIIPKKLLKLQWKNLKFGIKVIEAQLKLHH